LPEGTPGHPGPWTIGHNHGALLLNKLSGEAFVYVCSFIDKYGKSTGAWPVKESIMRVHFKQVREIGTRNISHNEYAKRL